MKEIQVFPSLLLSGKQQDSMMYPLVNALFCASVNGLSVTVCAGGIARRRMSDSGKERRRVPSPQSHRYCSRKEFVSQKSNVPYGAGFMRKLGYRVIYPAAADGCPARDAA